MSTEKLGTYIFTDADSPLTIQQNWGYSGIIIVNQTAVVVNVLGSADVSVNGSIKSSQNYPLVKDESLGWENCSPMEDFQIVIPAGGSVKVSLKF